MPKGQSIDELYIGLGLDISQLQLDFQTADQTVNQAISRLNSENKQIKLKLDIDLATLGPASTALDRIKLQEQSLNEQLQRQVQILDIRKRAMEASRNSDTQKGLSDPSNATRGAETRYLQQQLAVARLSKTLQQATEQRQKLEKTGGNGNTGLEKIATAATAAKAGLDEVGKGYSLLNGKIAAVAALFTTGAGLFNITEAAMNSGESLYKLSTRLHLTTSEASALSRTFSIAGVDIQSVIPYFSTLDKSVLSSSNGLNDTSMALMKFGINLKDSSGNLLPINEQLKQLANGYERAAEAGKLEEFQAEVLGRRGSALVPLLEDYNTNMQIASQVKTTGLLDPKMAHQMSIEWRALKAEGGQLTTMLGASLMPVAKELMPEAQEGLESLVEYVKSNKDEIKEAMLGLAEAVKAVGLAAAEAAELVGKLGSAVKEAHENGTDNRTAYDEKVLQANGYDTRLNIATGSGALIGGVLGGRAGGPSGAAMGAAAGAYANRSLAVWLSRVWQNLTGQWDDSENYYNYKKNHGNMMQGVLADAVKATSEALGQETQAEKDNKQATDENANAQMKAAQAMQWRQSAAGQLSEKIYTLTHNDVENATHQMYVEAEKAKANGVPDDLINQFINAQSRKIQEDKFRNVTAPMAQAFKTDFQNQLDAIDLQAMQYKHMGASDEEAAAWAARRKQQINAEWDRQVAEQIDSIWRSEYENRLQQIDDEKQAWIQKGLDEVKATEWAEEKKRQAQNETVYNMFTQQAKLLKAWRSGGMGGLIEEMRKQAGISDMAYTSPKEIAAFQNALKYAKGHLITVLDNDDFDALQNSSEHRRVQITRGNQETWQDVDFAGDYNKLSEAGKQKFRDNYQPIPAGLLFPGDDGITRPKQDYTYTPTSFEQPTDSANKIAYDPEIASALQTLAQTSPELVQAIQNIAPATPGTADTAIPKTLSETAYTQPNSTPYNAQNSYNNGIQQLPLYQTPQQQNTNDPEILSALQNLAQSNPELVSKMQDISGTMQSLVESLSNAAQNNAKNVNIGDNGTINLNINVTGLEDAENKVAEAGAELISKALGSANLGGSFAQGSSV